MTEKQEILLAPLIFLICVIACLIALSIYIAVPKEGDLRLRAVSTKDIIEVYECHYAECRWKEYND